MRIIVIMLVNERGAATPHFERRFFGRTPDPDLLMRIGAEMADVFIYLVRLADTLQVDLFCATEEKIAANERKYPAEKVKGSSRKYTEY